MARGRAPEKKKLTLKQAKNLMRLTADGKRRLDLSNLNLDTFPKCLLKLTDVDELDLSRNKLRTIPYYIDQFLNLRLLDLHSNFLEYLPESIGSLEGLLHLNLCNNRIGSGGIPPTLGLLTKLHTLNLGMNQLESLPSSLGKLEELQELGLFDNKLTFIPESIRSLPCLVKLNTLRNPLIKTDTKHEMHVSNFFLVHEKNLCTSCLKKCRAEREQLYKCRVKNSVELDGNFPGLITPNSVAKEMQLLWR